MQLIETSPGRLGPVASAALQSSAVDPFAALVAPSDVFRHPREVLAYPGLSLAEKRGLLASWASDACAVESCPALRCLPGCKAEPVPVDEVLAALLALDGESVLCTAPESLQQLSPLAFGVRWPRRSPAGQHGVN